MTPARWLAAACAAGGALLLVTAEDEQGPHASPTPELVRACDSRGEPSGRPGGASIRIGPVAVPGGSELAPASTFASRADQVGFRRYVRSPRGRALSMAQRRRLSRLARSHHETLKFPVHVRAGTRAILSVAPADRSHAALLFEHTRGRQVGPYWSVRVSDGAPAVALEACAAREPLFSGPGTVGPYTAFPGAAIVEGPRCVTLQVWVEGRARPFERHVRFGTRDCPGPGSAR